MYSFLPKHYSGLFLKKCLSFLCHVLPNTCYRVCLSPDTMECHMHRFTCFLHFSVTNSLLGTLPVPYAQENAFEESPMAFSNCDMLCLIGLSSMGTQRSSFTFPAPSCKTPPFYAEPCYPVSSQNHLKVRPLYSFLTNFHLTTLTSGQLKYFICWIFFLNVPEHEHWQFVALTCPSFKRDLLLNLQ